MSLARTVLLAGLFIAGFAATAAAQVELKHRWVYLQTNLLVDKNVDETIDLLTRAAKAHYNGAMIADYKFSVLDKQDAKYFANLKRVIDAAAGLKMELIPSVFSIGYSGGLLAHDRNLAAAMPVRNAPFIVRGGKIVPDETITLNNGDFEQLGAGRRATQFAGWDFQDPVVKPSSTVVHSGKLSAEMTDIGTADPKNGHGRICQALAVQPGRYYHLSVWIKTKDFERAGDARVQVLTEGQAEGLPASLNQQDLRLTKTADWAQYHIWFHTLSATKVRIYLGVWGGKGGSIWWDDVRIEPAGFFSVVRRPGCPLKVASADGKTEYEEGKDFSKVEDRMLGQGGYSVWHDPTPVTLPAGSRLREGDKLAISYYTAVVVGDAQVPCELTEPKVYDLLADEFKRVNEAFGPAAAGYMMQFDEIRVANWDAISDAKGWTAGQWLAEAARRCQKIIRDGRPGTPIYVWNDMFDPAHNAHDKYYLVKDTWAESWLGLDKDTVIVNWYYEKRDVNLKWFADRGHKQILAGYYDSDPSRITTWLQAADNLKVPGVVGVMYTTWQHNFSDLEKFSKCVDEFLDAKKK